MINKYIRLFTTNKIIIKVSTAKLVTGRISSSYKYNNIVDSLFLYYKQCIEIQFSSADFLVNYYK